MLRNRSPQSHVIMHTEPTSKRAILIALVVSLVIIVSAIGLHALVPEEGIPLHHHPAVGDVLVNQSAGERVVFRQVPQRFTRICLYREQNPLASHRAWTSKLLISLEACLGSLCALGSRAASATAIGVTGLMNEANAAINSPVQMRKTRNALPMLPSGRMPASQHTASGSLTYLRRCRFTQAASDCMFRQ